jgi:IS30 family transposase
MSAQRHLTLEDRTLIQAQLSLHSSCALIAQRLDKDPTTIAKEIKRHRVARQIGYANYALNDCLHRKTCTLTHVCSPCERYRTRRCSMCGQCNASCLKFERETCVQLLKAPYVCNGCPRKNGCSLSKFVYDAALAHQAYRKTWVESRRGLCFSEEEIHQLDDLISPLLKKRQSIHHIVTHNPDLIPWSERTLYTVIAHNLLDARNLDLARKIRRVPRKKGKVVKIDRACRINRTYLDFTAFLAAKSYPPVVQMDTVEGIKGGGNLLTLYFETSGLMLAFKRSVNNSLSVIQILNSLEQTVGRDDYARLFEVILTDNGTEFSNPSALEFSPDGHQRSRIFYCDPNSPYQKGAIERSHELIRMIIPKGVDFDRFTQAQINLMMSHINSYARKKLNDKSPAYTFSQLETPALLALLGVDLIPPNEICLSPLLLKK